MDLILYHASCPDGWCAAYICKTRYPEAALMGLNHGLPESELESLFSFCEGKDVIMVDYSLRTRELNDQLNAVAKSFRILDHHKTAQAVLEGASYATFDMKRSGAGLAWDYLFGKDSPYIPSADGAPMSWKVTHARPWWVNYTEDQDLWNWALPDSQEINAYLMTRPRTAEEWNELAQMDQMDAQLGGIGVRAYIEYYTRSVVAEAQKGYWNLTSPSSPALGGILDEVAVLNVPYVGVSEAGNALCKAGYSVALLWFERGDGVTQFSLRGDGSVDVSAIAKSFGGGGHNNAAGFQTSVAEGRELVDRILNRSTAQRASGGCIK